MTCDQIPAEVVAAAQKADYEGKPGDWQRVPDDQVRRLIAGAVAAERERIAQMAEEHHAVTYKLNPQGVYHDPDNPVVIKRPFADVIRSQP